MTPDDVAARVQERCGLDVQALSLVRAEPSPHGGVRVWAAMTEYGHFWAVEDGTQVELFRAVPRRAAAESPTACSSAIEAARRFGTLHPIASSPARAPEERESVTVSEANGAHARPCDVCGNTFTTRRHASAPRVLCPRCRHAERERLRYQQDPRYRARRLAYSAARYRQSQAAATGDAAAG